MNWFRKQNWGLWIAILAVVLVIAHVVGATIADNVREKEISKVLCEFITEEQKLENKEYDDLDKFVADAKQNLSSFTTDDCSFECMKNALSFDVINSVVLDASQYSAERINVNKVNVYMSLFEKSEESYSGVALNRYLYAEMEKVSGEWRISYFKFTSNISSGYDDFDW